jgi:hypothetical protein
MMDGADVEYASVCEPLIIPASALVSCLTTA